MPVGVRVPPPAPYLKQMKNWKPKSFDLKKLKRDLNKKDTISVFLRGHLYVEHVLVYFIKLALQKPNSIDLDRLSFLSKYELSVSLGLVSEDLSGWFAWINRCRNQVAHDIDFEPDTRDIQDALNTLPKQLKDYVLTEKGEFSSGKDLKQTKKIKASKLSLGRMLAVMVVILDELAQGFEKQQTKKQESFDKLKAALDDLDEFERSQKQ